MPRGRQFSSPAGELEGKDPIMQNVKKAVVNKLNKWRYIFLLYGAVIAFSSITFSIVEKHSFGDSLWWAFVTALTIGYGDIYAVTIIGRVITIFLGHAVPLFILSLIVAKIVMIFVDDKNEFTDAEQKKILADLEHTRDVVVKNAFTEAEQTEIKEALKLTRDTIVANAFTEAEQTDFKEKLGALTGALEAALGHLDTVIKQTDELEKALGVGDDEPAAPDAAPAV